MKHARLAIALALGASLLGAAPGWAQFQRYDYVWARRTTGTFTLDGILNEPQWAQAESLIIDIHQIGPIPGSGWKQEAGFPPTDANHAVFKFLTTPDNQLYMAVTVRDSSIGGSELFNYFDGVLMNIRRHDDVSRPASAGEHFMSWWVPDTTDHQPRAINHVPSMVGRWRTVGSPPTPAELLAWDAGWHVDGKVNSDTLPDQRYTFEMRFDLASNGYDINQAGGDAIEWNASLYDNDWYWPFANPFRWGINRTWVESPWGNVSWYSNVKILARADVTTANMGLPPYGPDLRIPTAGTLPAPTIDGTLNEAAWTTLASQHSLHITYTTDGNNTLRDTYAQTGKWRSGQFQPEVNKETNNNPTGKAAVQDPADATVRYFYKGSTLYLGLDFNDQAVQAIDDNADRYDGAIITLNDRVKKFTDNNLYSWRMTFHVGPTGQLVAKDHLPYLRDTLGAVQCALHLKPGTTVDTTGLDTDAGYTAEFAIDLTKLGYPADLGDHTVYLGVDILDGDSYVPFTDSYGTRTWWFRQYENEDGPCVAYLDPGFDLATAGVDPAASKPGRLELLGAFPNPVRGAAALRFRLPTDAKVDLELYDLQGRLLSSRAFGVQPAGDAQVNVPRFTSRSGIYLYRLHVADAVTGAKMGTLSGKMMVLR